MDATFYLSNVLSAQKNTRDAAPPNVLKKNGLGKQGRKKNAWVLVTAESLEKVCR
jgi:hypothetical protein